MNKIEYKQGNSIHNLQILEISFFRLFAKQYKNWISDKRASMRNLIRYSTVLWQARTKSKILMNLQIKACYDLFLKFDQLLNFGSVERLAI